MVSYDDAPDWNVVPVGLYDSKALCEANMGDRIYRSSLRKRLAYDDG